MTAPNNHTTDDPDAQLTYEDYSDHNPTMGGPIWEETYKLNNNTLTIHITDPATGQTPDHPPQTLQDAKTHLDNHISEYKRVLQALQHFRALLELPGIQLRKTP